MNVSHRRPTNLELLRIILPRHITTHPLLSDPLDLKNRLLGELEFPLKLELRLLFFPLPVGLGGPDKHLPPTRREQVHEIPNHVRNDPECEHGQEQWQEDAG